MRTIVFGASGFIGSHVCEQLLLAGHTLTAVVRPTSDTAFLKRIGARLHSMHFSSDGKCDSAMRKAITGHEVVYNCLASVKLHQCPQTRRAVDVVLTERLVKAAARAGVRRFVQLSTVQVYGFERPPLPIDEAWSCHASYPFNLVAQEREAAVRAAAAGTGIELVLVRPVNTFGRRDKTLVDILQLHRKGYMVVFGDGNNAFSCIDTRDLGRAMVLLGQTPKLAYDTYLVNGCDISWRELKQTLDRHTGRTARLLCIPARWGTALARVAVAVTPWSVDLKLTPFAVAVMSTQTLFDDRRIRNLGFQPLYGVADMVADFLRE